jgi:hypothetical protein
MALRASLTDGPCRCAHFSCVRISRTKRGRLMIEDAVDATVLEIHYPSDLKYMPADECYKTKHSKGLSKKIQLPFVRSLVESKDILVPVISNHFKIEMIRPVPPVNNFYNIIFPFSQIKAHRTLMSRIPRIA